MKRNSLARSMQLAATPWLACLALVSGPVPAQDEVAVEATPEVVEEAPAAPATVLARAAASGTLKLGYRTDASPFSWRDDAGQPAGYTVDLCRRVVDSLEAGLGRELSAEWVAVTAQDGLDAVADGSIDLLCGATSETLARRETVSFSIPVFPGGIGALVHKDAPARLRLALEGQVAPSQPLWRGTPAHALQHRNFSAVAGTTAESWLNERIRTFGLLAAVSPVEDYAAGVERVVHGESDVLFGDRAILADAVRGNPAAGDLLMLDRLFTLEPIALALPRGDEDFRLGVDRALSAAIGSDGFGRLFVQYFGEPNERVLLFFRASVVPD